MLASGHARGPGVPRTKARPSAISRSASARLQERAPPLAPASPAPWRRRVAIELPASHRAPARERPDPERHRRGVAADHRDPLERDAERVGGDLGERPSRVPAPGVARARRDHHAGRRRRAGPSRPRTARSRCPRRSPRCRCPGRCRARAAPAGRARSAVVVDRLAAPASSAAAEVAAVVDERVAVAVWHPQVVGQLVRRETDCGGGARRDRCLSSRARQSTAGP